MVARLRGNRADELQELDPREVGTELGITAVPWSQLRPHFIAEWEQGEHVAIIGPTGTGKTTLAVDILEERAARRDANVCILANKRRDPLLTELDRSGGWQIIREWPPDFEALTRHRVIFWPTYGRASTSAEANRAKFTKALDEMLEEGGWTVYVDEAIYVTETLGLRRLLDEYWNTARSSGVTLVASSQGTTWIPRAMKTQQSWVFIFRPRDEEGADDAARVAGSRRRYLPVIDRLGRHEFLLVQTVNQRAYVSKVET